MRWTILVVALLLAVAVVLTPAVLIQPFKPQTGTMLEVSYFLRRVSPWVTLALLAASLWAAASLWRQSRGWWRRPLLVLCCVMVIAFTWLSRQNHFEWMFHPLPSVSFAPLEEARFVDDRDMVMTVSIGGDEAAYPIRQLAYHHIVQDRVGGTPVAVTY